jgi:radical SAM-linked protein
MRFTGHLDLHRAWERMFRRAGLPLAYSQGFHPQPKINLAAALPLGFTSESEIVDTWLEGELPLSELKYALRGAAPPGVDIHHLEVVDLRLPALQTQVRSAEYLVTLLDPAPELDARLVALLAAEALPRERRGKPYDLRPLVEAAEIRPPDDAGRARLFFRLAAREGATGRPEEVLDVLGVPIEAARVHRTRLIFA